MSLIDTTILSTLILFLLLPYLRIVLSYIDSEEKYPTLWLICHLIEKIIIIGLVYIIIISILKNKEIDYDNILDTFKIYLKDIIVNEINLENDNKDNKLINKFNNLFNK